MASIFNVPDPFAAQHARMGQYDVDLSPIAEALKFRQTQELRQQQMAAQQAERKRQAEIDERDFGIRMAKDRTQTMADIARQDLAGGAEAGAAAARRARVWDPATGQMVAPEVSTTEAAPGELTGRGIAESLQMPSQPQAEAPRSPLGLAGQLALDPSVTPPGQPGYTPGTAGGTFAQAPGGEPMQLGQRELAMTEQQGQLAQSAQQFRDSYAGAGPEVAGVAERLAGLIASGQLSPADAQTRIARVAAAAKLHERAMEKAQLQERGKTKRVAGFKQRMEAKKEQLVDIRIKRELRKHLDQVGGKGLTEWQASKRNLDKMESYLAAAGTNAAVAKELMLSFVRGAMGPGVLSDSDIRLTWGGVGGTKEELKQAWSNTFGDGTIPDSKLAILREAMGKARALQAKQAGEFAERIQAAPGGASPDQVAAYLRSQFGRGVAVPMTDEQTSQQSQVLQSISDRLEAMRRRRGN